MATWTVEIDGQSEEDNLNGSHFTLKDNQNGKNLPIDNTLVDYTKSTRKIWLDLKQQSSPVGIPHKIFYPRFLEIIIWMLYPLKNPVLSAQ